MFSNSSRWTVKHGVSRTNFSDILCSVCKQYRVVGLLDKQNVCRHFWDSCVFFTTDRKNMEFHIVIDKVCSNFSWDLCVFSQRMAITRIFICVSANLCSVCKQYSEVVDKSNDLFLTLSQTTLTKSRF